MVENINSYSFERSGSGRMVIAIGGIPESRIKRFFHKKQENNSIETTFDDFFEYLRQKIEGKQSIKRIEIRRGQLYIEDVSFENGEMVLNEDFISISKELQDDIGFMLRLRSLSAQYKDVREETLQNISQLQNLNTESLFDDTGYNM